jgi:hypothetical protein
MFEKKNWKRNLAVKGFARLGHKQGFAQVVFSNKKTLSCGKVLELVIG